MLIFSDSGKIVFNFFFFFFLKGRGTFPCLIPPSLALYLLAELPVVRSQPRTPRAHRGALPPPQTWGDSGLLPSAGSRGLCAGGDRKCCVQVTAQLT